MKKLIPSLGILLAASLAVQPYALEAADRKEKEPSSTIVNAVKNIARLPVVLGKNITGAVALVGLGVTGVAAYLWLVKEVNAGGLNMLTIIAKKTYLENLKNPTLSEIAEWFKLEAYINIDNVTVSSAVITAASTLGYMVFKSINELLA